MTNHFTKLIYRVSKRISIILKLSSYSHFSSKCIFFSSAFIYIKRKTHFPMLPLSTIFIIFNYILCSIQASAFRCWSWRAKNVNEKNIKKEKNKKYIFASRAGGQKKRKIKFQFMACFFCFCFLFMLLYVDFFVLHTMAMVHLSFTKKFVYFFRIFFSQAS